MFDDWKIRCNPNDYKVDVMIFFLENNFPFKYEINLVYFHSNKIYFIWNLWSKRKREYTRKLMYILKY